MTVPFSKKPHPKKNLYKKQKKTRGKRSGREEKLFLIKKLF